MSQIRLVIADVDGTLVTQEKIITPRAEAGVAFAITSGRPPKGMKMVADQLKLDKPLAAFNGGVLVNPDLSVISQNFLPAEMAKQVIDTIVSHGLDAWLYTDRDWFVHKKDAPHVAREEWTVKFPPIVAESFEDKLGHVAKIVGVNSSLAQTPLRRARNLIIWTLPIPRRTRAKWCWRCRVC
jgi:hypothetical protein